MQAILTPVSKQVVILASEQLMLLLVGSLPLLDPLLFLLLGHLADFEALCHRDCTSPCHNYPSQGHSVEFKIAMYFLENPFIIIILT